MRTVYLFDVDGTILDTSGDIAAAANAARAAMGHGPLSVKQVEAWTGLGLGHLLGGVLPDATDAQIKAGRAVFVEHHRLHPNVYTQPFPGFVDLLDRLTAPTGLVTNKPAMFLDPLIESLGWRTRFGAILAGDALPQRKPSGEPIREALRRLGATADEAVFVGDTDVDQAAALDAGVRFVAVAWGRVAAQAERCIDHFDALEGLAW